MALLKIDQKAIDRTKQLDSGWKMFVIEKHFDEPTKDKKSTNIKFELRCIQGDNTDRYGTTQFNTKLLGMMVTSGFLPACGMEFPEGVEIEFDPDALAGKELWGLVEDRVWEGKIIKDIKQFSAPEKTPF